MSALDKILRLSGKEPPHGADVAHNAAMLAVMGDKTGTANHSTREGIVVHSVKNSDGAMVLSHHPGHSAHHAAVGMTMRLAASGDGSPTDGLVAHGIMNKSAMGRGESAIEKARAMIAADDEEAGEGKGPDAKIKHPVKATSKEAEKGAGNVGADVK